MADAYCVLLLSENYLLDNFLLKSTIDLEIVDVLIVFTCLTPLFLNVAYASKLILS